MHLKIEDRSFRLEEEQFDPFRRPPNLAFAQYHRTASKFGVPLNSEVNHKLAICPCCGDQAEVRELPLNCSRDDMAINGRAIPQYFDFLIFIILKLTILLLVSGIYNLVQNSKGNRCINRSGECNNNFYNKYAIQIVMVLQIKPNVFLT